MALLSDPHKRRYGLFSALDKNGKIDDYILYLLSDIKNNLTKLYVVCSSNIKNNDLENLKQYCDQVLIYNECSNSIASYKFGIQFLKNQMLDIDELIIFDNSVFGPIYPYQQMFNKMDEFNVDFWGITAQYKTNYEPFYTHMKDIKFSNLDSYFMAFRREIINSHHFLDFWNDFDCNDDNVYEKFESEFTKNFQQKGFSWNSYVDTSDLIETTAYPMIMIPLELVKNRMCPVVKRDLFTYDMNYILNETMNERTTELFDFLKNQTNYNIDFIWQNIIRTGNQYDIKNNLNLDFVLSSQSITPAIHSGQNPKIALVMHIYLEEMIPYCFAYAQSMPTYADVYITTNKNSKKDRIFETFSHLECNHLEIIIVENRGRDVSALLVGCKDVLLDYDYVCFAHDKKTTFIKPETVGITFSYLCFESVLKNKVFVQNVIETFERNPRLGILSPPTPNTSHFYFISGFEWTTNFENTKELLKKLNLECDLSEDKPPIAPLGTVFWFRPAALKALIEYGWEYSDFPEEPNMADGTFLHAIERGYPYISQAAGYYPGWVMPDSIAQMEITNMNYYLREINRLWFGNATNSFIGMLTQVKEHKNHLREVEKTLAKEREYFSHVHQIFYPPKPYRSRIKLALRLIIPIRIYNLFQAIKNKIHKS